MQRPIRPVGEWRPGVSLAAKPPSTVRVHLSYTTEEIAALTARLENVPPVDR